VVITQLLFALSVIIVWFWRYDSKKWKALYCNLRFTRSIHYLLMVIVGLTLYFYDVKNTDMFVLIRILGMLTAEFLAYQFSAMVNDIFDINCDRVSNKDRPLIVGIFDRNEYLKIGLVYLTISLLFAFWVSDTCFSIILVSIALSFIYSSPPFRLKRFFPLSSIIIGLEALLALLLGQLSLEAEGAEPSIYPSVLWLVFLTFLLSSNIKDLKDIEGDRICGIHTLPVMLGEAKARTIIAGLVSLSYLIVPLFFYLVFYSHALAITSVAFALANFVYISRKQAKEKIIFFMYFFYVFLVILFFVAQR
jgi:4-hydroxybenzoate polyprenyltransferase